MADINKTIKALTEWIEDPNAMNAEIDGSLVSDALELLKEQQAEIELLKQEKADAVKRITEEIDLNPAYEPDCGYTSEIITFNYQLGYQEGLQKALNIINEP